MVFRRSHGLGHVFSSNFLEGGLDMSKEQIFQDQFQKPIVFWGMFTCLIAFVLSFSPPLYLFAKYNVLPHIGAIMSGFALIFAYSGPLWFVEPLAYFPILGVPGTYMSFLSGNISNVRLPCAALAQEAAGVAEGSNEGAILSTLGIGASILINVIVLTIGIGVGAQLVNSFPPIVTEAFKYILPAIFGGVFGGFVIRDFKLGGVALLLGIIALNVNLFPIWITIPLCVFGTVMIGIKFQNGKVVNE